MKYLLLLLALTYCLSAQCKDCEKYIDIDTVANETIYKTNYNTMLFGYCDGQYYFWHLSLIYYPTSELMRINIQIYPESKYKLKPFEIDTAAIIYLNMSDGYEYTLKNDLKTNNKDGLFSYFLSTSLKKNIEKFKKYNIEDIRLNPMCSGFCEMYLSKEQSKLFKRLFNCILKYEKN